MYMKKVFYSAKSLTFCGTITKFLIQWFLIKKHVLLRYLIPKCRRSHQRRSIKKVLLKIFAIFIGKQLRWSLFLIKSQKFVKKRLQQKCFPVSLAKFLRTLILKNNCERLLLEIIIVYINPP